mgnify:CR=1 FL=1
MSLKSKTITGVLWSAVDNFAAQAITFLVGIILARLLTPAEFGLIGMLAIFISVSETFINSGFTNALIRKNDATETDYSTVFYFNLAAGVTLFVILFFTAPYIGRFFNEPQLIPIVRVLAIGLIISSLTIIQRTTLTKRIDFKLQAKISLISGILSGIIAIAMAYKGFGVWSLVVKTLSAQAITSLLLWLWNRWRPTLVFSRKSFKELFSFGSKLLASGLIDTLYQNMYYVIIGKFFSPADLGFFTRAKGFVDLPSTNLDAVMTRVTYPVLSQMQDDKVKLKAGYKRMIKSIMFISSVLLIGMAAIAEPMIITLIGEPWRKAILYLQIISFIGMLYPLHALNLNMLQVLGRSDLFLRLEIIKKIISIPAIVIGVLISIEAMLIGMCFNSLIAYFINSYWSGKFINYPMREQVIDILPGLGIALLMGVGVYFAGLLLPFSYLIRLIIQLALGAILTIGISELLKPEAYVELKRIAIDTIGKIRKK